MHQPDRRLCGSDPPLVSRRILFCSYPRSHEQGIRSELVPQRRYLSCEQTIPLIPEPGKTCEPQHLASRSIHNSHASQLSRVHAGQYRHRYQPWRSGAFAASAAAVIMASPPLA